MKKKMSFSALSTYMDCPFKRYLTYELGLWGPKSLYMYFGTVVDDAFDDLLIQRLPADDVVNKVVSLLAEENIEDPDVVDSFREAAEKRWKRNATAGRLITEFQEIAALHLYKLAGMFNRETGLLDLRSLEGWPPQHVITELLEVVDYQTQLLVDGVDIKFKGFIDLVCRGVESKKLYVIDIKTTGRPWEMHKSYTKRKLHQLKLYKKYLIDAVGQGRIKAIPQQELDPAMIETWYLFLYRAKSGKQEVKKISSDPKDVSTSVRMIEGAGRKIKQGFKDKNQTESSCRMCHLKERCHAGEFDRFLSEG
tara:strand:+ start:82 stop:1005 length:924 start_codon:yes stop_codon:yes gene_type:complete